MTTHREVVSALSRCGTDGDSVVLATVVRVTGSSYGGVGARMVIRSDSSTVGLVSGGCLESDLAEHARRVHASGRAEVVTYDTRDDDDAPWGLGLGCNGLIEVLLEPLPPAPGERCRGAHRSGAGRRCAISDRDGDTGNRFRNRVCRPLAHMRFSATAKFNRLASGARAPLWRTRGSAWPKRSRPDGVDSYASSASVEVAFEVVMPAVRLIVCGTGPDAAPVARFASQLGWDVTVVDHRPLTDAHTARFPGARVVECAEALRLADVVPLDPRTAAVVMSHNFPRDRDYVQALLAANVAYLGVLGPRARTERMLAELAAGNGPHSAIGDRLFAPVGLDLGGEGPDAIALAIISQVSAVTSGRAGGHLRDRRAPLHASPPLVATTGSI